MKPSRYSLLGRVPSKLDAELIEELVRSSGVRIERIVSAGHRSEKGFWYDQEEHEWVVVLQGRARLRYEEGDETLELDVGDAALIPAHVRHRVEWTDPDTPTVWLAVFWLEAGVEAL
ncbi:MAG: cupin domain-containing protein [Myxococcota bacterium]